MRSDLPIEAISINGNYIEDLIPGYKTIKTLGREALTASLNTTTIDTVNGEVFRSSRYPVRVINVDYLIKAGDLTEVREKLTTLNEILCPNKHEFVFNDEEDKIYTGIPTISSDATDLRNGVTGKYQIHCMNPLKQSVFEHEAVPGSDGSIAINYEGSISAKPVFEVEFTSDCGFVAFFDDKEHVLQFGNPSEVDGETIVNPTIFNTDFKV